MSRRCGLDPSYGQHDDLERSKAAGFVGHLIKPVAPKALETALAGALEGARVGVG